MSAVTTSVGSSSGTARKLFHDEIAIEDAEVLRFVGPKSDYYIDRWCRVRYDNAIVSWNWAAFFAPMFWLAYRKMYAYSAVLGLLLLWRVYVQAEFDVPLFRFVKYFDAIALGMIGNFLYWHHTRRKIAETKLKCREEGSLEETLDKLGGVSRTAVFVVIACFFAYLSIIITIAVL